MIVFIDGENFRQGLSDVLEKEKAIKRGEIFKYDLIGLLGDILGADELNIKYYASEIKTPNGYEPTPAVKKQIEKIRKRTRKWVSGLVNQGIEYIKAGNLKVKADKPCPNCKNIQDRLQEKGVDVRLALDIFEASLENKNKEIVVISSDTDLCPVYHKIKKYGVHIKYVCFATRLNRAVAAATDEIISITPEKAVKFLKKP